MDLLLPQYCHHLQCILGTKVYTVIASCEGIQDSFWYWIPRCGFRTLFSGNWFLDSNRLTCTSGFKTQNLGFRHKNYPNSGFHKQKCRGFQNPLYGVIIKNNQWKQGIMIWSSYSVCFQHHGSHCLYSPFKFWKSLWRILALEDKVNFGPIEVN